MKDAVWETRMDAARDDIKGLFNHAILGNRLKNVPKIHVLLIFLIVPIQAIYTGRE